MKYPHWRDLSETDRAASEPTTFGAEPPAQAWKPPRVVPMKEKKPRVRKAGIQGKRVA